MAKKQTTPSNGSKADPKNPFKTVSENLPFFPDQKDENSKKIFIGSVIDEMKLGDSSEEKENIPVYIAVDIETGEKFFIVQSYAIHKAVETAKRTYPDLKDESGEWIVFRFEFKGKSTANGKPFNQFNTAYCTLEAYQASKEA